MTTAFTPRQADHLARYDAAIATHRPSVPRRAVEFRTLPYGLMPQVGVVTLAECVVLSGDWNVIFRDRLFMDLYAAPFTPPRPTYIHDTNPTSVTFLVEEAQDWPHENCYMLGGSTNYAHWLLDVLPRLAFLSEAPDAKIVTHEHLASYQRESLRALGVDESRLIGMPYPGAWRMKKTRFPSTMSLCGTQPSVTFQTYVPGWLRKQLLPKVTPARAGRKLFLSRADQSPDRVRLVNEAEVGEALKSAGFEPVVLDGMPFLEQVQLFTEASCVVGPHGAGFANAVFAPPSCAVIELIGPRWSAQYGPTQFYQRQSAILGQPYTRVIGTTVEPEKLETLHLSTERYRVDVPAVMAAVGKVARRA